MMQQVTGAASALVLILAYLVLVESMMALVVLLTEFIWRRVRSLRLLPQPSAQPQGDGAEYKIGGSLIRW